MTSKELERLSDLLGKLSEIDGLNGDVRDAVGRIRSEIQHWLDDLDRRARRLAPPRYG